MAPKRIDKVSIFTNMSVDQASSYLKELLQSITADGVLMFADDIKGLQKIMEEAEKQINPKPKLK